MLMHVRVHNIPVYISISDLFTVGSMNLNKGHLFIKKVKMKNNVVFLSQVKNDFLRDYDLK